MDKQESNKKPEIGILDKILNWASKEHFIPIIVGANCCGHHIYHLLNNIDEVGIAKSEFPITKADLLIINGPINKMNLSSVLDAYENLGAKKYVMTVGSCSKFDIYGENPNRLNIEDKIPVDIHVPGCPPLKKDFVQALKELKNR